MITEESLVNVPCYLWRIALAYLPHGCNDTAISGQLAHLRNPLAPCRIHVDPTFRPWTHTSQARGLLEHIRVSLSTDDMSLEVGDGHWHLYRLYMAGYYCKPTSEELVLFM